ncbi:MAG: hypothetical protein Q7K35_06195 [bacterium]|nr:hypothetical protein [bacterium]
MPLRLYLLIMSVMTAFCWLVFGYIIWTINPQTTNSAGFWLFYLSLFLALSGTAAIAGFLIRFVFLRHELAVNKACLTGRQVKIAFRQSFLFSGFIVACLFLLARELLSGLNLLILIVGLSTLEFFLLSYGRTIVKADDLEQ